MNKTIKKFDAVEMTRKIRDENYEKYKALSLDEYAEKLSEEGKATDLYRYLMDKN